MFKSLLYIVGLCFSIIGLLPAKAHAQSRMATAPVDLVNPLMGTDSDFELSNGNTYPAIATPWGMNFWSPQTGKNGDGWMYAYSAKTIRGLKQTHQPSPWINDYGVFSLMPVVGAPKFKEEERKSYFSHKAEEVKPYYYSVYMADYDVLAEMAPTERANQMRFTFPEGENSWVVIDAFHKGSSIKVEGNKIIGYSSYNSGGVPENFKNYFIIEFDKDIQEVKVWDDEKSYDKSELSGEHVGALVRFKTSEKEQVTAKIASSFISHEQAALNLKREIGDDSFETTKENGRKAWETEFDRFQIKGGTEKERATFFSCLYRTMLFPRKFYEYNEANEVVHYSPYNGEVLPGYMFTDNGFWDTFRAVFPFFTVMYQELDAQIMQGLANTYKESGWLPEWASPGHRDCMIGSNSASLIADAYIKGIRGFDAEVLYEAMIKNTKGKGPLNSVGRFGAEYYNKLGYVPYDVDINENAARTLEYAYADFCIAQMGKEMGKSKKDYKLYMKRAQNYRNLYDQESGWMRGKNENGEFQSPFNPLKWGDAFTEGNSLHYTWSVFQDIQGLVGLMGGPEQFNAKLDEVFEMAPKFDNSYYGFTIHEIREMQIANMGNYAHGNQPIQHMIYLYNYAGQPWKAQARVRDVMNRMYTPYPDGYCGDEDNGQTSAWYVFSAMGFYPVAPGTPQYVIGSPLFEEVSLKLENGNTFTVKANDNKVENVYIQSATLNGNDWNKNFLNHEDLMKGGVLEFDMGAQPNKERGTQEESFPFSIHKQNGKVNPAL
ncbi:GH92 family glycosyl hydrolase [Persicobacter diffluens]|uniref:Alpha-1 2-mannosidase n=1 Tax=Persicobacter diffluens TaxID=981 RepID=A0AAN4W362_9BACT|nr:alpha-1 2-mannosidase [Persicobacter diffluens]